MVYIFDSSPLIHLFKNYYLTRFPSLWAKFDEMVECSQIVSVEEVYKELTGAITIKDRLSEWAIVNKDIFFHQPDIQELGFIREIFRVKHFEGLVTRKAMLSGNPVADPFVIAAAKIKDACVVTSEGFDTDGNINQNAPKIPYICQQFSISCCNLEQFMEKEGWMF